VRGDGWGEGLTCTRHREIPASVINSPEPPLDAKVWGACGAVSMQRSGDATPTCTTQSAVAAVRRVCTNSVESMYTV
jgi:hypothetical protein